MIVGRNMRSVQGKFEIVYLMRVKHVDKIQQGDDNETEKRIIKNFLRLKIKEKAIIFNRGHPRQRKLAHLSSTSTIRE